MEVAQNPQINYQSINQNQRTLDQDERMSDHSIKTSNDQLKNKLKITMRKISSQNQSKQDLVESQSYYEEVDRPDSVKNKNPQINIIPPMPDLSLSIVTKIPPMPNLTPNNVKIIPPPPVLPIQHISNKHESVINSQTLSPKKMVSIQDNKKQPDGSKQHQNPSSLRSSLNKAHESSFRQSDEISIQQDRTPKKGTGQSQIESETPQQRDQLEIKIILKNNSQSPTNKTPLLHLPLFEQAKQLMYENQMGSKSLPKNEESLQTIIQKLHTLQTKEYEKQIQKLKEELKKQTNNVNQTLKNSLTLNNMTSVEPDEQKKLFEENQELKMRNGIMEADLQFQAQKTKDLQRKYESDLDNLRNQLKGSQTDQFIKQQIENKKLMSDNSLLMKEIKFLNERLQDEQKKVIELFDDAMLVRDEIQSEIEEYENMRNKFEQIKTQNKALKAKLGIIQSEDVDIDLNLSEISYNEKESNQEIDGDPLDSGKQFKRCQEKRKPKVQMVSVGISKAQSLISLTNGFTQKLEDMIEEKSKSIAQVLTKSQLQNLYGNFYYHPYALQTPISHYQYPSNPQQTLGPQPYNNKDQQNQKKQGEENVVEMSLNESEDNDDKELIRELSMDKKDLKSQMSDINMLKNKVKEMKQKHDSEMLLQLPQQNKSSQQYLQYQLQQQQQQLILQQQQMQQQQRSQDNFKTPNGKAGPYHQSLKHLNVTMMGSINAGQNTFNYQSIGEMNTQQQYDLRFGSNAQGGDTTIKSKAQATPAWIQEHRNTNDPRTLYQQPIQNLGSNYSSPGAFHKLANFRMNQQDQVIKESSSSEED